MAPPKGSKGSKYKQPEIKRCNCDHEYQDLKYGKGMRVHNYALGKDNYRCTVCESTK